MSGVAPPLASFAALESHVRALMAQREPSHDFLHVTRVVANATRIAAEEKCDPAVARTAALLHELVAYKKNDPRNAHAGEDCADAARALLLSRDADPRFADDVAQAIRDHAFSKGSAPATLASAILQDADRLDAVGAIGVARCFATAADMKSAFYDEADPFAEHRSLDDKRFALDHFAKKLLLLEARMHTRSAREIARGRGAFLRAFIEELRSELGVA